MYIFCYLAESRMKVILCTSIFLAFNLIISMAAQAATRLELMSAPVLEAVPRQMLSAGILVTNDGSEAQTYQITFNSPAGWLCSAFPETLDVEGNSSEVLYISINQPAGASAGDYPVIINCYPAGSPSDVASVELTVRVPVLMQLAIRPNVASPSDAYSGEQLGQIFRVTNAGNLRARISIELETSTDWPVEVIPEERWLDLEVDQSANVVVSTSIPEELVRSDTYRLVVTVRPEMEPGVEVPEWKASTRTRVIPRQISSGSNYATLDGTINAQASFSESGDLSTRFSINRLECEFAEGRRLEIGPFNQRLGGTGTTSFGQRRSITAMYEDDETGYVRAGDFSLSLMTPLLGRQMSGRGGDVLYRNGDNDYRAFYSRSRGSIPEENFGFQFSQILGADSLLRLTALRDSELDIPEGFDREAETSTNLGLFMGYKPSESLALAGEVGWSNASEGGSDSAWCINGSYRRDGFSSNCEWLRAGDDFRGGWRNTELLRTYLAWSPFEDLNLWTNYYNRTRLNESGDYEDHNQDNRVQSFGASWNVWNIGQLRVSHNIEHSSYPLPNESNVERITTEYSFSRDWDGFGFSASWKDRTEEDIINGDYETERLLRLDCSAHLNRNASLQLGYSNGETSDEHSPESESNSSIRFSGDFTIDSNLDASFKIEQNMMESRDDRTSISGALGWLMSNGSRLNLDVRGFIGDGSSNTEVAVGFSYPLSVPLTWLPRKGCLEGRVFHSEDPERGMENVRVSVGRVEMVTDENGRFTFPSLSPGEYELTVDTSSLGVGMTPDVELPLVFNIEAGSTSQIDIPVRQSVVIGGQVLQQIPGLQDTTPSLQPLPDMVIEIQINGESYFRVTDNFGRFLFTDLDPGSYIVILRSERLPLWHRILDPASISLDLMPGDSRRDLEFIVAPMERNVEITTQSPDS